MPAVEPFVSPNARTEARTDTVSGHMSEREEVDTPAPHYCLWLQTSERDVAGFVRRGEFDGWVVVSTNKLNKPTSERILGAFPAQISPKRSEAP